MIEALGVTAGALAWLAAIAFLAGIVRGFSGFGTALIYVPLAATVLPPIWVLVTLTIMDLVGPLPNVPRALRDGNPRLVAALGLAALAGLLPGLWLLTRMDDAAFRWLVAGACLATVAALASGWRWTGRMTPPVIATTGFAAGLLGGTSGLSGPPVILSQMAAPLPAAVIRANVLLFLVLWDVIFVTVLTVQGRMVPAAIALGAVLILPYLTANVLGARLFRPDRERAYRLAAYILIAAAAVAALPLWSVP